MTRSLGILAAVILPLSLQFSQALAQDEHIVARFLGPQSSTERVVRPEAQQAADIVANPSTPVITFNPAAVGISSGSAQKIVASFSVSGYSGSFTPTATLHYGHDYTLGAVTCTGSGPETCNVTVSFIPTLPGSRKDALLLMDGATVLATVLLGGIGQSGFALIQPGVLTSPLSGEVFYIYQSVVDENGTVYFTVDNGNAVYSYTKAGVLTLLPITVTNPHAIDIDGAGTLYIAQNTYSKQIITYSTTSGTSGAITVYPPAPYVFCSNSNGGTLEYLYSVAVDLGGNLFALEILCNEIFELTPSGTYVTTAINPSMIQPSEISVDANDNVFIGGYDINELTSGGVQTQININGAGDNLPADAASTIYATRYPGGGVAELPASNYSTPIANLDPLAAPLGDGLASDGTLYVGNYTSLDKIDRSQGAIAFGEQNVGVQSPAQDVGVYNGGNESLTVSNMTISGTSFKMAAAATNPCTKGIVITPGSFCQVSVTTTPPHAGTFAGTITFTSNSLNTTSTAQQVALSAFVYGPYVTPSPKSLTFPPQLANTTSPAKAVTLTNRGDAYSALLGTPVSSNPAFKVASGTCANPVAVGSNCKVSVTFTPTTATSYSGTVTISVDSTGGGSWPSVTFAVSGSGTEVQLTPKSWNFGNQAVSTTSAAKIFTVTNKGSVTVNITGIAITGTNFADFAELTNCGTSLLAGKKCYIQVTFTPLATGLRVAQVAISDDSGGSPQTIGIEGTGTP